LVLVSIEELSVLQWRDLCFQCGILSDVLGDVLFLKELWHYSTMEIGLAMTVAPLRNSSALLTGKYGGKHGHAKALLIGGLLYAASGVIRLLPGIQPRLSSPLVPDCILTGVGLDDSPEPEFVGDFDLPPARYSIGRV